MLSPGVVNGQSRNNIDVALVIDSSGSMKITDPDSLRIPAAKLFISLLGSQDRAAVLSFSDQGYTIDGLTPVDNDANKNRLLNATDRISSKGLYTNLYSAFKKGMEVLLHSKKEGRDQIIILMSDGMMDVGDAAKDTQLLTRLKSELSMELKNNNVKVYAIAFTDQSDRKLLEKLSKQTGGFYNLAQTDKDFHVIFTSIFESLKSPEMLPMEKNTFLIDPSIQEVTIVVSKDSPDSDILINSPDGQQYSGKKRYSGISWFASDNFDMITVQRPVEGRWEILYSTAENNKAYIITDLALETNFEQLYAVFGENLDIKAWLEKEGSVIREGEVLESTEFSIELNNPDGNISNLKPLNKGDGIFHKTITPFKDGNYRLRVVAKGQTYEREKAFLFNVANLQESKEDVKAARKARLAEQEDAVVSEEQEDPINWTKIIIQFVLTNIFIWIMVVLYIKRQSIKDIKLIGKVLGRLKGTASSPPKSTVPGKIDAATENETGKAEENKDVKTKKRQIILDEANSEKDTEQDNKAEIKKPAAEKPALEETAADEHSDEAASSESDLDQLEAEIQRLEKLKQQDEVTKSSEVQSKVLPGEIEQQSDTTDTEAALSEQGTTGKESEDELQVDAMSGQAAVESPEEKESSNVEEQQTGAEATKDIKEMSEPDTEENDFVDTGAEESRAEDTDEEDSVDDMWADALNEQAAAEDGTRKENIHSLEQNADRPAPDENINETPEPVTNVQQSSSTDAEEAVSDDDSGGEDNVDDLWADAMSEQAAGESSDEKAGINLEMQKTVEPVQEDAKERPETEKEAEGTVIAEDAASTEMPEIIEPDKEVSGEEDIADMWAAALDEQAKEDGSIAKTDSLDNNLLQNSEEHTEDNSEKNADQMWADVLSDYAEEESGEEKQSGIKNDPKGTSGAED